MVTRADMPTGVRVRWQHLAARAYGNGRVTDEAALPGNGRGGPAPRGRVVGDDANARYRPGLGEPVAINGLSPNDQGWTRDRHPYTYTGHSTTGRDSGVHDPLPDGPVRPSTRLLLVDWRTETGTDATRFLDPRRAQYRATGSQDGFPTRIYGGTPGYWAPYGDRGSTTAVDKGTTGSVQLPGTIAHGLHTHTVNPRRSTLKTYRSTPQMVPGRLDRLSNSRRAGQSYSATTTVQGGGRR